MQNGANIYRLVRLFSDSQCAVKYVIAIIKYCIFTIIASVLFPLFRFYSVIFMTIWLIYTVHNHRLHRNTYIIFHCLKTIIAHFFFLGGKWLHMKYSQFKMVKKKYSQKKKISIHFLLYYTHYWIKLNFYKTNSKNLSQNLYALIFGKFLCFRSPYVYYLVMVILYLCR